MGMWKPIGKQKRDSENGRFVRTREVWDKSGWDDGYIARGRMRVYRPDYPGYQLGAGYAMRAHVVWWLNGGEIPKKGMILHHIDGNKLNDNIENLQLLDNGEHTIHHLTKPYSEKYVTLICEYCKMPYNKKNSRTNYLAKKGKKSRFCSRACLQNGLRKPRISKECAFCGKEFETEDNKGYRNIRCCSKSCAGKLRTRDTKGFAIQKRV